MRYLQRNESVQERLLRHVRLLLQRMQYHLQGEEPNDGSCICHVMKPGGHYYDCLAIYACRLTDPENPLYWFAMESRYLRTLFLPVHDLSELQTDNRNVSHWTTALSDGLHRPSPTLTENKCHDDILLESRVKTPYWRTVVERWKDTLGMDLSELERAAAKVLEFARKHIDRCTLAQHQGLPVKSSLLVELSTGHVIGVRLMNNDAAEGGLSPVLPLKDGRYMGTTSFRKMDFLQEGFDRDVLVEHYLYLTVIRDGLEETEDEIRLYDKRDLLSLFGIQKRVRL